MVKLYQLEMITWKIKSFCIYIPYKNLIKFSYFQMNFMKK